MKHLLRFLIERNAFPAPSRPTHDHLPILDNVCRQTKHRSSGDDLHDSREEARTVRASVDLSLPSDRKTVRQKLRKD